MSEKFPEYEPPPIWFQMLPRWAQYRIMMRQLEKITDLIKDPETPKRLREAADAFEQSLRILQGKDEVKE